MQQKYPAFFVPKFENYFSNLENLF
jgi:hypothetical protein